MTNIEIITTWVERFNDRDVAGCAELYAEDAPLHVAFAPPVEGRAAIRSRFEPLDDRDGCPRARAAEALLALEAWSWEPAVCWFPPTR